VHRVLEAVVWWGVCTGVWLLTLSAVTSEEVVLALAAGAVCGPLAVLGRELAGGRWRPQLRWARWLAAIPVAVVAETVRILAMSYSPRRRTGQLSTVQLPGRERADVAAARDGLAALAIATSPAAYVVDTDPDRREWQVHLLGRPARSRVDPRS
jgi:multisubunit Na+/H+ antiporter MnhE subunit